jgi:hypothetical protein
MTPLEAATCAGRTGWVTSGGGGKSYGRFIEAAHSGRYVKFQPNRAGAKPEWVDARRASLHEEPKR